MSSSDPEDGSSDKEKEKTKSEASSKNVVTSQPSTNGEFCE